MNLPWVFVGELDVAKKGRLPLEYVPSQAGIYRLLSGDYCYIGQAKNLCNRVYEYCRPTQDLEHEHRLNWLLHERDVRIEVLVGEKMNSLSYRRSLESQAMREAKEAGLSLWNLSTHSKPEQYRMRMLYHEAMIRKYKKLLNGS